MCCYKIEKKQEKNDVIGVVIKIAIGIAAVAGVVILIRALFKKFKSKTCLYCDENDCCDCDICDIDDDSLNCVNEKECCDCNCKDDADIDLDSATEIEINGTEDDE